MLKVNDIRLNIGDNENLLYTKVSKILNVEINKIRKLIILKKSLDARRKNDIHYKYSVCIETDNEFKYINAKKGITEYKQKEYIMNNASSQYPPIIVGFGPAGIFCALILARSGLKPIILERGEDVDSRIKTVERFFSDGILNENSNVQFGEGGAGTFSDGKLNTGIKNDRISFVLKTLYEHGAPACITYDAKPHIGTDILPHVIKSIRNEIINAGGKILFSHKFTRFEAVKDGINVFYEHNGKNSHILTQNLVLALGHSSRDTLQTLYSQGLEMQQKAFSMGMRIEHPQELINKAQYGDVTGLPTADYKLSCSFNDGSSAYTFCMCPGGYVVAAASEHETIVTNGMSNFKRDGANSNSAILVTLTPEDFPDSSPLSGMYWQRSIEHAAYKHTGCYKAPVQTVGSFLKGTKDSYEVIPTYRPGVVYTNLRAFMPEKITNTIAKALPAFGKKIKGFDMDSAILTAPETRSSSPVRIIRNETYESSIPGIYPCGEGAGYAGGIMSAAVDGMKVAEAIIRKYVVY